MSFAEEQISSAYASRGVAGHILRREEPVRCCCITFDGDQKLVRCRDRVSLRSKIVVESI